MSKQSYTKDNKLPKKSLACPKLVLICPRITLYVIGNLNILCDNSHYKPFEIPESWVWCKIGNITTHNTGKTLDKEKNKGLLRKYITTSNLYWGYFELTEIREMPIEDEELERCRAIKGDLLICEGGEAGRSAIWTFDNPICFQNHIHRMRPLADISPYYIYFYGITHFSVVYLKSFTYLCTIK
ncbi:hypothetical protein EZS27_039569 [termite gut metagenome]|uniref:Type I restriction modification DNA specificity domain-containing protein n=1 Tax=termite gut metagenome TaxID=433724 RepID=A0A5J4PH12_9ZZZZ